MKVLSFDAVSGDHFPPGLMRLRYKSAVDGIDDWALLLPGENIAKWIIVLHGHGSAGDQLYNRQDIRQEWLPNFLMSGAGILTVNLRGNAWMSPAAVVDLHQLLQWMRVERKMEKTLFYSGSMGGSSNLIYAALHPEDVNALVTLGAATDIESYYFWCLKQSSEIAHEIARAIKDAYGGEPDAQKVLFKRHSVVRNASRLTMPSYLAHGGSDILIPVEQARDLAQAMQHQKYFFYHEIPGGNHDSPLWDNRAWNFVNQYF